MSNKLEGFEDERRFDKIIEEILDLKLKAKDTQGNKLKIQKLQQELVEIETRLKI